MDKQNAEEAFVFYRSFFEAMEGLGDADKLALFDAIARQGVTFIPCVLLLPKLIDPAIWGMYLAQPIADLITFLTALPMAVHILRRFRMAVEDESITP